jgi:hypothetical protein
VQGHLVSPSRLKPGPRRWPSCIITPSVTEAQPLRSRAVTLVIESRRRGVQQEGSGREALGGTGGGEGTG